MYQNLSLGGGPNFRWQYTFTPEFKAEVVLEAPHSETSQAELCRRHNLREDQLSKWKQQFLENAATVFASDKQFSEAAEQIAHIEHLVGRLTMELDIHKKAKAWLHEKADLNALGGKVHLIVV